MRQYAFLFLMREVMGGRDTCLTFDHEIAAWRRQMRDETTRERRPDLWDANRQLTTKGRLKPDER